MLKQLNATKIGLLTGVLMAGLSLSFYYSGTKLSALLQYTIYVLYAAGIIWAVYRFRKSEGNDNKFGSYFQQGFKCFIVATLIMVIYTFVFNKLHPEFTGEVAMAYKEQLIKKGNSTPIEIETAIEEMKKSYLTVLIASSIFGDLIFGSLVTAVSSLLFMKRK